MRLICGILNLDGAPASAGVLDRMGAAMTAPGLAPSMTRRLDGVLGLAALDFTGRSEGLLESGGWTGAADVRLNRVHPCPEETVVEAARRHGLDFPDRIDGDFAVALWRRETQELWLGRDFIGVRPLVWTWRPGRWFAFASLPQGLHGSELASSRHDPVALGAHFVDFFFRGGDSGFADIAYLEAGHSLCVRPQDVAAPRPHRAYRPSAAAVGGWRGAPEQAAETLRDLLQAAVFNRMPQAGPVACHLSGGLDSSAVTVLAAREARRRGGRVLALSMVTPEASGPEELNERPLIADVLAQESDVAHMLAHDVTPMPGRRQIPDWPGSIHEGPDDLMMAAAAAFGAECVLSGVGGDEGATYNGANLYLRLFLLGNWASLTRELPARARTDGTCLLRAVRNRLIAPLLAAFLRRRRGVMSNQHGAIRYLKPAIADAVRRRRMSVVLQKNSPAERVLAFADHHIPSRCTYYSILAARHGLAVSFPLLDRQVVDFMLSLPTRMFLADGQSRQPFRRAMRGILPDRVRLARNKVGLHDRLARYADHKSELLSTLAALRASDAPLVQKMFDLDAIQEGLETLPEPHEAGSRISGGPGGSAHWASLMAVNGLIAAHRFMHDVAPGDDGDG